jgi:hypothetical protein
MIKQWVRSNVVVVLGAIALGAAGCIDRNVVFVTSTKFGLDVSQRPDEQVEVTLGYDRAEVASVPVCDDKPRATRGPNGAPASSAGAAACTAGAGHDATGDWDAYSLLGAFHVDYGNPFLNQPVTLRQVMASGFAARKLAADPGLRAGFMTSAAQAVNSADPTPTPVPTAVPNP